MPTLEPQAIDAATRQALEGVTTATLTTVLLKKGLRNVWIRGALPVAERLPARRVGRAFTLRFAASGIDAGHLVLGFLAGRRDSHGRLRLAGDAQPLAFIQAIRILERVHAQQLTLGHAHARRDELQRIAATDHVEIVRRRARRGGVLR